VIVKNDIDQKIGRNY